MVASLAGTGESYVALQGRMRDDCFHIQGEGVSVNRPYGVAVSVGVPANFAEWVENQPHTLSSLYGSGRLYARAQARVYPEGQVHIQIPGTELNRPYGAVLEVENESLSRFVQAEEEDLEDEDEEEEESFCPDGNAVLA